MNLSILQAALDNAFTTPPQQFLQSEPTHDRVPSVESQSTAVASESSELDKAVSSDDSWKEEYDAQVHLWRAQSAEQREKAEKERLRWEAIRAQEKEEAERRKAAGIADEPTSSTPQGETWEKVGAASVSGSTTADSSQIIGDAENVCNQCSFLTLCRF